MSLVCGGIGEVSKRGGEEFRWDEDTVIE